LGGCELPHAVDLPLVGELIGYGERLIGGEWRRAAEGGGGAPGSSCGSALGWLGCE